METITLKIKPQRNVWADVQTFANSALFAPDYDPKVIEVYDEKGLLWGLAHKEHFYQSSRPPFHKSEYIAWYFDEELGLFLQGKVPLINRLGLMALGQTIVPDLSSITDPYWKN